MRHSQQQVEPLTRRAGLTQREACKPHAGTAWLLGVMPPPWSLQGPLPHGPRPARSSPLPQGELDVGGALSPGAGPQEEPGRRGQSKPAGRRLTSKACDKELKPLPEAWCSCSCARRELETDFKNRQQVVTRCPQRAQSST